MQHIIDYARRDVVTIRANAKLSEVAHLMKKEDVGSVVVLGDSQNKPRCIITDRDIVIRALAEDKSPEEVTAAEAGSGPVTLIKEDQDIEETIAMMLEKGVRRAPIVNNSGKLCGLVSLDDLIIAMMDRMKNISGIIKKQIH